MKKYNDGYVLPLVMVVLVILSAFSLSVLSPAVSNLKAQQTSIERMGKRYELIGEAEEVLDDYSEGTVIFSGSDSKAFQNSFAIPDVLKSFVSSMYTPSEGYPLSDCIILAALDSMDLDYGVTPEYNDRNQMPGDAFCDIAYRDVIGVRRSYTLPTSNQLYDATIHLNLVLEVLFNIVDMGAYVEPEPVPQTGEPATAKTLYECSYSITVYLTDSSYTITTKGGY